MEEVVQNKQMQENNYNQEDDIGQPKISLPEIILLNLYIIPLDLIGLALIFFALDDFWIIDILTFPVTQFYFRMKGAKATADLVGSVIELIPYIGALPIKSVAMNLSIYFTNHQDKIAGLTKIKGLATKK